MLIGSIGIGLSASTAQLAADLDRAAARLDGLRVAALRSQSALAGVRVPEVTGPARMPTATPAPAGGGAMAPATAATGTTPAPIGADLGQTAAALQAGFAPLIAIGVRLESLFDHLGGTITTLARRIDASMKFTVMNAALAALREKLRGLGPAVATAQGPAAAVQARLTGLVGVVDRTIAAFRAFAAVKSWISSIGDVAGRSMSQIRGMGGAFAGVTTSARASAGAVSAIGVATAPLRAVQGATNSLRATVRGLGRDILVAMGVFALTYKAVAFIKGGITAAANLNETVTKTGYVFGAATEQVTAQAETMARSFGLSKRSLLDAASSFGLILRGAGMSQEAAAGLSNRLTRLAVDATSFYNVPLDESLDKIRSGLVGQARPLREFGVLMEEDNTKAEAMRMGLAKAGHDLDKHAKVLARVSLIEKGLATASGDLERTFGSAANQFRRTGGGLGNFAATIGGVLLPALQAATLGFNSLLASTVEAFERSKRAIEGFVSGTVTLFGDLATAVSSLPETVSRVALSIAAAFTNRPAAAIAGLQRMIAAAFGAIGRIASQGFAGLGVVLRNLPDAAEIAILKIREIFLQIPVVAGRAWAIVVGEAQWAGRSIATVFGNLPAAIGTSLAAVGAAVGGVVAATAGLVGGIAGAFGTAFAAAGRAALAVADAVTGGLVTTVSTLVSAIAQANAAVISGIVGVGRGILAVFAATAGGVSGVLGTLAGWIGGAFAAVGATISAPFVLAASTITSVYRKVFGWLADQAAGLFDSLFGSLGRGGAWLLGELKKPFVQFKAELGKIGVDFGAEMAKARAGLAVGLKPPPPLDLKGLVKDLPNLQGQVDAALGRINVAEAARAAGPLSDRFRAMGETIARAFDPARLTPLETAGRRVAGVLGRAFDPDRFRGPVEGARALAAGLTPSIRVSGQVSGAIGAIGRAAGLAEGPVGRLVGHLAGAEARGAGLRSLAGAGQALAAGFAPAERAVGRVALGFGQVARAAGLAQGPAARLAEALARRMVGRPAVPAPIDIDEDLQKKAAGIKKDTLTPFEKFQAGVKDLKVMLAAGLITKDVFGREFLRQGQDLAKETEVKVQHAGALELGSAEFRSAILKFRGAGERDPVKKVADVVTQQLILQRQQHETEKKTAAAVQQLAGSFLRFVF